MSEQERGPSGPEQANWKAPEATEQGQSPEITPTGEFKFDPNRRPNVPHGFRMRGKKTVFHELGDLWDLAKAEHDNPGANPDAITRYENRLREVNEMYRRRAEGNKPE